MKIEKPSPESNKASNRTLEKPEKPAAPREIGGFAAEGLPEPTRYGDWDVRGRCSDF